MRLFLPPVLTEAQERERQRVLIAAATRSAMALWWLKAEYRRQIGA